MEIVVFTALIGSADVLHQPAVVNPRVRYVCLTDQPARATGVWEARDWSWFKYDDPRRAARIAKIGDGEWFPDADVTIWIDASFELLVDPETLAFSHPEGLVTGFAHPDRCRVSDEALAVILAGLAPAQKVHAQIDDYCRQGFDSAARPQQSLTTTGLLVRWQTPLVQRFNRLWQAEVAKHTLRDQLSVDYCAWKTGITIRHLPGHYRENVFAKYHRETHRQGRSA